MYQQINGGVEKDKIGRCGENNLAAVGLSCFPLYLFQKGKFAQLTK